MTKREQQILNKFFKEAVKKARLVPNTKLPEEMRLKEVLPGGSTSVLSLFDLITAWNKALEELKL